MKEWIDKIVNVLLEKKSGNLQKGGTVVLETFLVVVGFWFDILREDFKRGVLLQFSRPNFASELLHNKHFFGV